MKIKKDNLVLIITGKDKGKKGKVLEVLPSKNRIVVEGVNIIRKHRRPKNEGEKGQVVEIVKSIDVSNIKLICPKCTKSTRVGYKIIKNKKYKICKKCQQEI
ncbi:MAG: 50S ribosomal protein L24 [Candidatus Portnoybacteria bacterium]|nr:50S ribosomal protein L24 [Candidatus Portnoybacteria bacterium]